MPAIDLPLIDLETLVQQRAASVLSASNKSIYEKRHSNGTPKFEKTPHVMHFYYLSWIGSQPKIDLYEWDNGNSPIAYSNAEDLITTLARNARSSHPNPTPVG